MGSLFFTDTQLEAIAGALGDTSSGLTGSEIGFLLSASQISDVDPTATKRVRIYNAVAGDQNHRQSRVHILAFIRKSMKPERYVSNPDRFELMRGRLNQALLFAGLAVDHSGVLQEVTHVRTIAESRMRAQELRADLVKRGVHEDILKFCKEELLVSNYFHAVMEAVKSIMDKLRSKSGLNDDGASLIDKSLSGEHPLVRINTMSTDSEKSEQKGFANLLKGVAGMFRNTTAHEARIHWTMSKDDAEDLLSMASLIHRRLDKAHIQENM
ncbi:TIGR02391 family protein [Janthinobacterium sp. RB2R34]|uniref:TIGR02391 family protein n=1 Tax=Janthinobacterium sp. RB2R34 TaxID=3424193 RepID=UPI003F289306